MTMVVISFSLWRIFKGVFISHLLIVCLIPLVVCQKAADAGTGRGTGYVLEVELASLILEGDCFSSVINVLVSCMVHMILLPTIAVNFVALAIARRDTLA